VHPNRYRIEMLRAGGASCQSLANKFGVPGDTIWRHWTRHVTDEVKASYLAGPIQLHQLAERAAAEGLSLLDYLSIVRGTLMTMFQSAAQAGDRHGASASAGRLLETLREIGRLTGELGKISAGGVSITNNMLVMNSPAFANLQSTIIAALAPYPEARLAVVTALRSIEDDPQQPLMLEASPIEEMQHAAA